MTMGSNQGNLSKEDIDSFARKLEEWGNSLPPKEKALLGLLVARAQNAEEMDVQGYALPSVAGGVASAFQPVSGGGGWVDVPSEWYRIKSGLS